LAAKALEEVERRYIGFFEELGNGGVAALKHLIEQVDATVDAASADDVNLLAKLYSIDSARASVEVVARYYGRFLPASIVNSLRAELMFLLDRAREVAVDV
jgi:hypothetical protein